MKTALCSAVAALCAAALLSSIEAEGKPPSLPPCPQCPADQQTSHPAFELRALSLFLSVTTSRSLFLSFREMPLLPCPAPSVLCFSRLVSRMVAPSLSLWCAVHTTSQTGHGLSWCSARGAHCQWTAWHGQGLRSCPYDG